MKVFRSSVSNSARRMSGLSNGGTSRLSIRFVLLFIAVASHITRGDWRRTSRSCDIDTSLGKVMSYRPATKLSNAVERLATTENSMPSR